MPAVARTIGQRVSSVMRLQEIEAEPLRLPSTNRLLRKAPKQLLPHRRWSMGCGASSEGAGPAGATPVDAPLKPVLSSSAPTAPSAVPAGDEGASPKFVPSQHSRDTLDKGFAAGNVVSATHVPSHNRRPSLDEKFFQAVAQRGQHAWIAAARTQPPPLPTGTTHARGSGFPLGWALGQARAARAADRLRLAAAWVSLGHDLARQLSGLSHRASTPRCLRVQAHPLCPLVRCRSTTSSRLRRRSRRR